MNSPNLNLSYLAPAQAQKHVTVNESLRKLDALIHIAIIDRDQGAPPDNPDEGVRYLIATPASGEWSGRDGHIGAFQDGAWAFYIPQNGWIIWVEDEQAAFVYTDQQWQAIGSNIQPLDAPLTLGINAQSDQINRLVVKSDAILFSHDDVTPGSGDMRMILNKSGASDVASCLFQTNYSGRAEFGLTGDDNFHLRVSPDGDSFLDALSIDHQQALVTFHTPAGGQISTGQYGTNASPSIDLIASHSDQTRSVINFVHGFEICASVFTLNDSATTTAHLYISHKQRNGDIIFTTRTGDGTPHSPAWDYAPQIITAGSGWIYYDSIVSVRNDMSNLRDELRPFVLCNGPFSENGTFDIRWTGISWLDLDTGLYLPVKSDFEDGDRGQWNDNTVIVADAPTDSGLTQSLMGTYRDNFFSPPNADFFRDTNWADRRWRIQGWVKNNSAYTMRLGIHTLVSGTRINNTHMIIKGDSQNVGIDEPEPTAKLTVNGAIKPKSYLPHQLPDAAMVGAGAIIHITDAPDLSVMAFSDGTNWRQISDNTLIT